MKRRTFIKTTGIAAGSLSLASFSTSKPGKRPNILFIFADQLRSMELGCYGGDQVKTPNIDRLANEGVLFKYAYSTAPVCSPFRAMLMTGNYPVKNGMIINDHFLKNPTPMFAEICKEAGYNTGYIGKWHIDGYGRKTYIPPERRRGFDFWRTLECTHTYFNSEYYHQDEQHTRTWPQYDAISQTEEACSYLRETSKENPFCLFLSWGPPHDPYTAPKEYMDRFNEEKIRLRGNVDDFASAEKLWNECDTQVPENLQTIRKRFYSDLSDRDNTAIKAWYKGYYAHIEALDDCMGRIIQTLEKKGELDNTIIVFTSDHGDNLGSHRQYGKQMPYEESISIPFIIRYPEKIKKGIQAETMLSPIDMMPTILSLAGLDFPGVDGMDLSSAAMGNKDNQQEALLIMKTVWLGTNWITNGNGPWRGVRTKRYTYARKSDSLKPWMLFDNEKDPLQLENLVDDPEYSTLVKKLDQKTNELLIKAGDPENPLFFANRIQEERDMQKMPDRRGDLFPVYSQPGKGFKDL